MINFIASFTNKKHKPLPVFLAVLGAYLAVQAVLLLVVGDDSTLSLSVIPILFSGWYLGPWWAGGSGGVISACFIVFKAITIGFDAWIDIAIGGGSIAIFTLIGLVIGRVEELNRLLKQELLARKIAEQQLSRSNKELEQFAYIASHDLQEPLRKISAFGSRLASKYIDALDEQGLDYLRRMQNAAVRMQHLIDGLLTYSRVTTKAQPFSLVDLLVIVNEVLGDLETKVRDTGATVECSVNATIGADPLQMRQLFQNLIGNALKYHAPGVAPVVTVRAATEGQRCTITVSDNGIGFEQQYAEQIFGVFTRLHGRSSEYEGSGIGLSVCRKIVERHGGTITARSEPGKGATFTAVLPLRQAL
jgi:light-regulated signal transduction histidine kinase (bacteriophytochrome)